MASARRMPGRHDNGSSSASAISPLPKMGRAPSAQFLPKWEDKLKDEAFRKMALAELKIATNNFDRRNLLGSGGFGDVFRGQGPQGQEYAVKRAKPGVVVGTGTSQGVKDFEREVVTMSQLSHKHLVRLLGYCTDKGEHIVVYELMQGGSLAYALHGPRRSSSIRSNDSSSARLSEHSSTPCSGSAESDSHLLRARVGRLSSKLKSMALGNLRGSKSESSGRVANGSAEAWDSNGESAAGLILEDGAALQPQPPPLSFMQRVDIATGTAEALHYLHSALAAPVVHRDIKPGNILLDSKMRAKVGDFGLVKLMRGADEAPGGMEAHAETTRVTGTRGYMDPDYWAEGKASPAVDVFSFGVVLLELLTGRKPLVSRATDLNAMASDVESPIASDVESPVATTSDFPGELLGLEISTSLYTRESGGGEPTHGQQVALREWVDTVLRSKKSMQAVLDPSMDLDLGVSGRALKTLEDSSGKGASPSAEEAYRKRKDEAVEKSLKSFLQLALKCTGKTARRPPMAEVATQLQQIRRELRAARENQQA